MSNSRPEISSGEGRQLLVFICQQSMLNEENHESGVFDIALRTVKHAMTHVRQFQGNTTAVVIDGNGSVLLIKEASEDMHIDASDEKKNNDAVKKNIAVLVKKSKPLPAEANQFSKALIVSAPGYELGVETADALGGLLETNMSEESYVRVQVCNWTESGVQEVIPEKCELFIPSEWSAISPNDSRAIDFGVDSEEEFNSLKLNFGGLLKAGNATDDISRKVPEAVAISDAKYRAKQTAKQEFMSRMSAHYARRGTVKGISVDTIKVYDNGRLVNAKEQEYTLKGAVLEGNVKFVKAFLRQAKINSKNAKEYILDPLSVALDKGYGDIVNVILKNKDVLLFAIESNNSTLVNQLLESPDINLDSKLGSDALLAAIDLENVDLARKLVDLGADAHREGKQGQSPFVVAVHKRCWKVVKMLKDHPKVSLNVEVGNKLLLKLFSDIENNKELIGDILALDGIDLNQQGYSSFTPLMYAMEQGSADMVKMLLKKGADVFITDRYSKDAVDYAYDEENYDALEILLTHIINIKDKPGYQAPPQEKYVNFNRLLEADKKGIATLFVKSDIFNKEYQPEAAKSLGYVDNADSTDNASKQTTPPTPPKGL